MADIFNMADTWNNGATTFDAIKMDVTDTASDAASRLLWLGVGGSAKLTVGKGGKLSIPAASNENAVALTQSLSGASAQSILDMAATWNTSGTPTALKINVIDTASNANSLLMDLQVGGVSQVRASKSGQLGILSLGFAGSDANSPDAFLQRDAADTIAQRNGSTSQVYRNYYSYTDGSNYQRLVIKHSATIAIIAEERAGTGGARSFGFGVNGNAQWIVNGSGHLLPTSGAATDFGTSAISPRNIYYNTSVLRGSTQILGAQGAAVADATDNPSAITQLNALLSRLRAHGLIAT